MLPNHQCLIASCGYLAVVLGLTSCGGLPTGGDRTPSTAIKHEGHTPLAAVVAPHLATHPGQSGMHALFDDREAFAARLALADAARSSIDVQYYIWHDDPTSKVLMERILRAADRGVRVRLLLDDIGSMHPDSTLLAIDNHPNIQVRLFNPVSLRSPRLLGALLEFRRINRRMHNKSFTVDGQVAIVGGRNIGDEYFDASKKMNFVDLDLAVIGPVVGEVSNEFDLYWNNQSSIPITSLTGKRLTPEQSSAMRQKLIADDSSEEHSMYAESLRRSEFARHLRNRSIPWLWGRATIVSDHPDKVSTPPAKVETHLAPELRELVDDTRRELLLVSPYFIPGKEGVDDLAEVHRRGVRVVVITNSLASTDGVAVQAKYGLYRKSLLKAGIELYELKSTDEVTRKQETGPITESVTTSTAGLHAKTFAFDRRVGFVGSYNLDPRSNRLNTEMGVLFDCPILAARLPETLERDLAENAYRVELDHGRLVWVTRVGGKEVRYYSEPDTSLGKRIKARVLSWLPIEHLL
jgi:putative cardiolipin synthase